MVLDEFAIRLIERIGISAGFLILMYMLYVKTQTWNQKYTELNAERYEKIVQQSQERYEDLANKYIETANKIISDNAIAIQCLSSKIEAHDARSVEIIPRIIAKDELIIKMHQTIDDMYQLLKDQIRKNGR